MLSQLPLIQKTIVIVLVFIFPILSFAEYVRGIYVTQDTFEHTKTLEYLITQSKKVGINTFVVDIYRLSKKYDTNMKLLKENNINYIARIEVFPNGGTPAQVSSVKLWEKRYRLAEHAADLGAKYIQLDYIRYNTKQKSNPQNARDIYKVIHWFKQRLAKTPAKLEIDVFGEVCAIPSPRVGQDIMVFADTIDSLSPMVYPSHYYPPLEHSNKPYETIYDSLKTLNERFKEKLPFKVYPFIEVHNFRYRYSGTKRIEYIYQQIKAVNDSPDAEGWYAWSPTNKYNYLFKTLQLHQTK